MNPIIIIGSGLAGYTLAKEFRKQDHKTPLMIITAGEGQFYSKPQLSTALTQKKTHETLAMADAKAMAEQLKATIRTKTVVTKLDIENKYVYVGDEKIAYSKLVLALGADVIQPPVVGNAVQEIFAVNDLEGYAQFQKMLSGKKHIAILGAGLVGCEFANDLINAGHKVDVVSPAHYPVDRLLPEAIGWLLQQVLANSGVVWHLGQLVSAIDRNDKGYLLTLSQQRLQVDIVLSAIGLRPHTDLAANAGIHINRGIMVNRHLQTSAQDVYALGDCAEVNGVVLLFVAPLLQCARALAKTLAGAATEVTYPAMPVVLKTPVCPIVVMPPPQDVVGDWRIEGHKPDLKALFYDEHNKLYGFALTGKAVQERAELLKEIPPLF